MLLSKLLFCAFGIFLIIFLVWSIWATSSFYIRRRTSDKEKELIAKKEAIVSNWEKKYSKLGKK